VVIIKIFMDAQLFITHYQRRPKEAGAWIPLVYFTQREGELNYYFGLEFQRPISQEEINRRIESGTVVALNKHQPIRLTEILWLTSEEQIFIADKKDPKGDPKIRAVI
jgi:hypothetical protein